MSIQIKNADRQVMCVSGLTKVAHRRSGENRNLNELVEKIANEKSMREKVTFSESKNICSREQGSERERTVRRVNKYVGR